MTPVIQPPGPDQHDVRDAAPADAAALSAVQVRAYRHAYRDLLDADLLAALEPGAFTEAWRAAIEAAAGGDGSVLVASASGIVVGLGYLRRSGDPDADQGTGELATLVVDPARLRAGHGSRLLWAAAERAREAGWTSLRSWSPAQDTARLAFLRGAGLEPDGARRELVGQDGRAVLEVRLSAGLAG